MKHTMQKQLKKTLTKKKGWTCMICFAKLPTAKDVLKHSSHTVKPSLPVEECKPDTTYFKGWKNTNPEDEICGCVMSCFTALPSRGGDGLTHCYCKHGETIQSSTEPKELGDIDEFMKLVKMFKEWFEFEEQEVSDFLIGRFASRTKDLLVNERKRVIREIEVKSKEIWNPEILIKHRSDAYCKESYIQGRTEVFKLFKDILRLLTDNK